MRAIAQQLCLAYLGRPADVEWLSAASAAIGDENGPSPTLLGAFYAAALADGVFSTTDDGGRLVDKIFWNIFGFGASACEQEAWAALLDCGALSVETAPWAIFTSYLASADVPATYQQPTRSKLIAIDAYARQLEQDPVANAVIASRSGAAIEAARRFIAGVSSQAVAAAAVSGIAAIVADLRSASLGPQATP